MSYDTFYGQAACKALSELAIDDCKFSAAREDSILQVGPGYVARVPARLSVLTCLTSLSTVIASSSDDHFDLEWVYPLVSLRDLTLHFTVALEVSRHLTQLTKLTSSSILGIGSKLCHLALFSVDWEAMQALKYLELGGLL